MLLLPCRSGLPRWRGHSHWPPFPQPELIYKTGDIGRYNEAGELLFVSRRDYQIKHMGHRVELGEIEVNVAMLPDVQMAACIYDSRRSKIVLYYVGDLTEKE